MKTEEESKKSNERRDKIEELIGQHPALYQLLHYFEDEIKSFAAQSVREDRESRWISVSERLPEPDINVLCYSHSDMIEGYYNAQLNKFCPEIESIGYMENDVMIIDVTHWQPLPEKPK